MQIKLLLTLLFITILAIIISSGCGGGSGTTQPASLITPTPDYIDTGSGGTAYITFNVKWPEQGNNGSMTLSKNGSTILNNVQIIDIYILDCTGDPNSIWTRLVAAGNIRKGQDTVTIPAPAIKVKIYAEAFNSFDPNNPTSRPKKQLAHTDPNRSPDDLKVGNQNISLKLIQVTALNTTVTKTTTARSIIASDTGSSNEYDINANLQLMYGTPFPVSTVILDTSGEISEPMEGQTVKFKVIQGSGQLDSDQAQTDPNGDCKVHFTSTSAYNVIEASYQYDPDDPNTIVTSQCTIGENYIIRFTKIEPDIHRPYTQSGSLTSTLNTELLFGLSNNLSEPPVPISGKVINFTIVNPVPSGSGYTVTNELSSNSATTTTTGLCDKDIIYKYRWFISNPNSTHGMIPQTYVIIRATYTSENGNTYSADAKINIWGIMWRNNIFKIINPQDL